MARYTAVQLSTHSFAILDTVRGAIVDRPADGLPFLTDQATAVEYTRGMNGLRTLAEIVAGI
jgi:hypothetical protein